MTFGGERFDRWLTASVFFHGALFTFVIFSPSRLPAFQSSWGSPAGGSGGINVKIVGNVSGVPLARPEVVQEQAPANESPGFYKSEEAPPPPPPDKAELIPETKAPVKATPPPKPPKPAPAPKSTPAPEPPPSRSEEHTSELQSPCNLVCRLLLEKKKKQNQTTKKLCTANTQF